MYYIFTLKKFDKKEKKNVPTKNNILFSNSNKANYTAIRWK